MGKPPDSPLGKLYTEHVGFIVSKSLDSLLNQYAEDCLLISTLTDNREPLYVHGRRELDDFFKSRIFSLSNLTTDLTQWAETRNELMIVEEIRTTGTDGSRGSVEFYDNWQLRDGKIAIHFAGTVRYPDGTYADGTGFPPGKLRPSASRRIPALAGSIVSTSVS